MQYHEKNTRTKAALVGAPTESADYCDRAHVQLSGPRGAEVSDWFGRAGTSVGRAPDRDGGY